MKSRLDRRGSFPSVPWGSAEPPFFIQESKPQLGPLRKPSWSFLLFQEQKAAQDKAKDLACLSRKPKCCTGGYGVRTVPGQLNSERLLCTDFSSEFSFCWACFPQQAEIEAAGFLTSKSPDKSTKHLMIN